MRYGTRSQATVTVGKYHGATGVQEYTLPVDMVCVCWLSDSVGSSAVRH